MAKTPLQAPVPVQYRVVTTDPLTKADLLKLFKSKELEAFRKYLIDKRLAAIVARGQAPVSESDWRRGGIMMLDEVLRDFDSLNAQVTASIAAKVAAQNA